MDLGSAIIGAIVIAICFVPFILMSQNRKKRERKKLQSLSSIANKVNCNISNYEICGDYIIGIDETKNFVFFSKPLKDKVVEQYINLSEIQSCKVKNTSRTVADKNEKYTVIDKLELNFSPFDKNKKEIALEFFNTDNCIQLVDELQSIEKWSKIINGRLKTK